MCLITFLLQIATLVVLAWVVHEYIRRQQQIRHTLHRLVGLDCDELIDQLLDAEVSDDHAGAPAESTPQTASMQARLAALAAGGQARLFALTEQGRPVTAERVDNMSDEHVQKLYSRYEAKLGALMTKSLGTPRSSYTH